MRYVLTFLGGAVGMYIILKVLSVKKSGTASQSTERFKELAQTQQVYNLLMTNEFR
jgi:hypothetical protein